MTFWNRSRRLTLLVAAAMLTVGLAAELPADLLPGAQQRMLDELKYLASDDLEGRGVDTAGINLAAERIHADFAAAGLDMSWADDGYQEFEMVIGTELRSPNTLKFVEQDGSRTGARRWMRTFETCSFGAAGEFDAPIVFCGYGIEAEDLEYDDFAGVDVKGKVALIMRRTPQQANEEGMFADGHHGPLMKHAALTSKLKNAVEAGAVAVLFVNDPYSGRSELVKLEEQQTKAEQAVVEAAEKLVGDRGIGRRLRECWTTTASNWARKKKTLRNRKRGRPWRTRGSGNPSQGGSRTDCRL